MREIKTSDSLSPVTRELRIQAIDEPGPGGANHDYLIEQRDGMRSYLINFQNGPIKEAGVNGLTHEALIAIVMDRLDCFQKGDYACKENAEAFHHLDMALGWLGSRTKRRVEAGTEGTMALDAPYPVDPSRLGANVHGIGPDAAGGPSPYYQGEPHAPPTAEPHADQADHPGDPPPPSWEEEQANLQPQETAKERPTSHRKAKT